MMLYIRTCFINSKYIILIDIGNFLNVDSAYAANDLKSQANKGSKWRVKSKFSQVLRSQCKRLSYMSSKTISPTAADELAVQNMKSGWNNADKEPLDFNLLTNKLLYLIRRCPAPFV